MRKIMIVTGSPRKKGNTAHVAGVVAEAARAAGADVAVVDAAHMSISPCTSCRTCQKSDEYRCALDDGMKPLYDQIREVDVLVMATPIYWYGMSAQMKTFLDRLYACVKFRGPEDGSVSSLKAGAGLGVIITAGGDAFDGAAMTEDCLRRSCGALQTKYLGTLLAADCASTEKVRADEGLRARSEAFGRKIASA